MDPLSYIFTLSTKSGLLICVGIFTLTCGLMVNFTTPHVKDSHLSPSNKSEKCKMARIFSSHV